MSWRRGRATLPSLNIKDCPYSISLREGRAATPQSVGVEQEETCPALTALPQGQGLCQVWVMVGSCRLSHQAWSHLHLLKVLSAAPCHTVVLYSGAELGGLHQGRTR